MRSKKVILDTNLWISFLISHKLNILDDLIEKKKVTLIFSTELIEEFIVVAKRPKFKGFFSDSDIEELLRLFKDYGKLIKIKSDLKECRDLKDNFLLNLAVDGKSDFLITGDKDLLILKKIKKTQIVSMRDFLEIIS